jgi:hypothetical protein
MIDFGQISDIPPDFVLEVHTEHGNGDGARAFRAIDDLIKALINLDRMLAPWTMVDIQTIVLLENVPAHSVMALLRYSLGEVEDGKRPSMVAYFNKATVEMVNWLNALSDVEPPPLAKVVQKITTLAGEMNLVAEPRFEPSRSLPLLGAAVRLHQARKALVPGDRALLLSNGSQIALDGGRAVTTAAIEAAAAAWKIDNDGFEMLLVAESPDYRMTGKWVFLHEGRTIEATIEDASWLSLFRLRSVEVRPGDVMRVVAATEALYNREGELICKRYLIRSVSEIVQLG